MDCGHWIVQDKPQEFKEGMFKMIVLLTWKNLEIWLICDLFHQRW